VNYKYSSFKIIKQHKIYKSKFIIINLIFLIYKPKLKRICVDGSAFLLQIRNIGSDSLVSLNKV
jgi:hypothetical protein